MDISITMLLLRSTVGPDRILYLDVFQKKKKKTPVSRIWYYQYHAFIEVFWKVEVLCYLVYLEVEPFFRSADHNLGHF